MSVATQSIPHLSMTAAVRPTTSNGPGSSRSSPVASRPKTMMGKSVSAAVASSPAASPGSSPKLAMTQSHRIAGNGGHARGLPTPPPTPPQGHAHFIPASSSAGTGGVLLLDGGTLRMDESLRLPLWALLRHPRATAQLSAFVRREHSEENLEFVQEVERFRNWATRLDAIDPKWESKYDERRHAHHHQLQQLQQRHNGGHNGNDEKYALPNMGTASEKKRRSSIHHTKVNANGTTTAAAVVATNNSAAVVSMASVAAANGVDRRDTMEQKMPHVPPLPLPTVTPSTNAVVHHGGNNNNNNASGSLALLHHNEDGTPRGGARSNLDRLQQNDSPTSAAHGGPSINPHILSSPQPNNSATSPGGTDGTPPIRRERIRLRGERHQRGDSRNGSPQNPNATNNGGDAVPANDSPSSPSTPDEVRGARSSSHSQKFPRKLLPPLAHMSRNETRMSVDAAAITQLKAQHQAAMEAAAVAAPVNNRRGQSGPFRFPHPISAYSHGAQTPATVGSSSSTSGGTLPPPSTAIVTNSPTGAQLIAAGHSAHASLISSTPSPLMGPFVPSSSSASQSAPGTAGGNAAAGGGDASFAIFSAASTTPVPDLALTQCIVDPAQPHATTSVSTSFASPVHGGVAPPLARTGSSTGGGNLRSTITSLDVIHERGRSSSLTAIPSSSSTAHTIDDGTMTAASVTVEPVSSLSSSPAVAASAASVIGHANNTPPHGTLPPPAAMIAAPLVPSISSPSVLIRRVSAKRLSAGGPGHQPSLSGGHSTGTGHHTSIAAHAHFPSNSSTHTAPSSTSSIVPPPVPPLYTAMSNSGASSASSSLSTSSNAPAASSSATSIPVNPRVASFVPHYIGSATTGAQPQPQLSSTPHTPTHHNANSTGNTAGRPPSSLSRRRLFSPPSPANAIQGSMGGTFVSSHAPQSTTVVTFGPPSIVGIHATPLNPPAAAVEAPPTIWGQVPYKAPSSSSGAPGSGHGNRVGVSVPPAVIPPPLPLPPSLTTNLSRPHTPVLTIPPLLPALAPMSLVNPLTSRLPMGASLSPSFAALPGGQFSFAMGVATNNGGGTGSMKGTSSHAPIYVNHTPRIRPEEELITRAIADEAARIWSKFCPDAPMAISWPPRTIRTYKTELSECGRVESPFVFNEAQQQELDSLKNDILPRFYQSREYRTLTQDLLTELAVKINAFERWQTGSEVPVTAQVEVTPPSSPSIPRSPNQPPGSSHGSRPGTAQQFPVAVTRLPLPSTIPHQVHTHTPHPTPPFGSMPSPGTASGHGGIDSQRITLPTISITAPTPPPPRQPQPPALGMSHLYTGPSALSVSLPPLAPMSPDPSSTNNLLYSPPMSIRGLMPVDTDLASTSILGNSPLAAAVDAYNAHTRDNTRSPQHLLLSTSSTVDPLSSIYNAATAALLNSPSPLMPVRHLPTMTTGSGSAATTPMGGSATDRGGFTTARGTMHVVTTPSVSVPSRTIPLDGTSPSADTIAAALLLPTPMGVTVAPASSSLLSPSFGSGTSGSGGSDAGTPLPQPVFTPISFPTAPSTPLAPVPLVTATSMPLMDGLPASPPSLSASHHNSDSSFTPNHNSSGSDEGKGSPSSVTTAAPTSTAAGAVHAAVAAAVAVGGASMMTSSMAGSHTDDHGHGHHPMLVTNTSGISQNHGSSSHNLPSTSNMQHHTASGPPSPPQVNGSLGHSTSNGMPHSSNNSRGSTTPTPPARRLNPLGNAAHAALRRQHSHSHLGSGATIGVDNQGRATYFFPTDYDPPSRLAKSQTDTGPLTMNGMHNHAAQQHAAAMVGNGNRLSGFLMGGEMKTTHSNSSGSNSPLPPPSLPSLSLPFTGSLSINRTTMMLPSSSHTTPAMSSALATVVASSTFLATGAMSPSQTTPSPLMTPNPPISASPGGTILPAAPSLFVFRRTKNEDADRLKFSFHAFFDNPLGLQAIGAFMRAEYSVDNLDFVIAVDDYKSRVLDHDEMGREARRIYSVYLEAKSQHEVTYPAKLKTALLKQLDHPHKEMFSAIYESVLATCRVDVFPRFVKSKLYRAIIDDLKSRLVDLVTKRRRQREEQKATTPVNISTDAHIKFTRQQTARATAGNSAAAMAALAKKKARGGQVVSFDEVLMDPEYLQAYITFCTREHSEENILFWCAAHGYTRAAQDGAAVEQLRSTAAHIFDLYLRAGSAFEILIDTHFKRHIIESMEQRTIDGTLFIPAQKQVLDLMKKDSGVRFVKCDEYLAVLKKRRNDAHGVYCATCW